ncbi:epsin N-terminal homology domain-containing protein / clathrin assembly protein-like protein [Perilla frutescens var. frutescens]|nr:epsin N-terminal homology domain-containing protein / clathrin assembly protein-like protein [Perilla frutescens var. frutescens]
MALRKAIGAVKDQTSIGIAKVASNLAPELEVAVVKATGHDNDPASEKYIREILQLTSYSQGYVSACVVTVSKRLGKTRDWIVALKCLMLIHRLLNEGDAVFQHEIMFATRRGTRLLNLSDFRDEAHSNSWDHSSFVRTYGLYLDQKLELMAYERKQSGKGGEIERFGGRDDRANYRSPPESSRGRNYEYGRDDRPGYRSPPGSNRGGYDYDYNGSRDEPNHGMRRSRSSGDVRESTNDKKDATPLREMTLDKIFGKMGHLQRLLDRFLACRPTGLAKNERMILVALYVIVKESFKLYADVCEVLSVLLDKFFDMEHQDCLKAFDAYASAAKQIDELVGFYSWCKEIGVARSSEYPEVQKITDKLLETLDEFVRDRTKALKSPERKLEIEPAPQEEQVQDMNEVKALPPPENITPPRPAEPEPPKPAVQETKDLVDLREVTADDQGNKLALALFAGPVANNGNGSWEAFPSNGEPEVSSAWQNPAAEAGKADWELALVESASHLSKQKAAMGGGLDSLLLDGMYDQGIVRQHTSTTQLSGGSASSVALPGAGASKTPVLALPAPDGTVQTFGHDPFAASLCIPPPAYVQMADMEKKQGMLVQEQMVWQQYSREGMQGQTSLAKIGTAGYYAPGPGVQPMMTYGMPPVNGAGVPPAGYTYGPF